MKHAPLKVAAITATVVLFSWGVLLNLWVKSDPDQINPAPAIQASTVTPVTSLADSIQSEANVDRLKVEQIEGIVIIRGKARDQATVDRINKLAKDQGFGRVANLIQIAERSDDELIVRAAERQLGQSPALDGCRFNITSANGVVSITGTVERELQKDLIRDLTRRVDGVKEVHTDLRRAASGSSTQAAAGRG